MQNSGFIKIVIIQRIFSNYRKAIFDELNKNYTLKVLHSKNKSGIDQIVTNYSKNVSCIKYFKKDTNVFLNVFLSILKFMPQIIIHEASPGIISLPLTLFLAKVLKIKFVMWGHGYNRKKGFRPNESFESKLRLFYYKFSDAIIVYGNEAKNTLKDYVDIRKIFVANNTINMPVLNKYLYKLKLKDYTFLKKSIGFIYKYNLIFIGRMLKEKHPEILIAIFEKLKNKLNSDIGIHFVGQGEMLSTTQTIVKSRGYEKNFFFYGSIYDDMKVGKLLFCSDLMVMPGALGLSVNHAFAFNCPVVSFVNAYNGPHHGPEVEYVLNNETGFLIEGFNIDEISKTIYSYFYDEKLQKKMIANIEKTCTNIISLEKMVEGFKKCISYVQSK